MAAISLDLPQMLDYALIGPEALNADLAGHYVIDLRSDDMDGDGTIDFEEGHVPGAQVTTLADVVTFEAAGNGGALPVVVVCATGQTAGHAAMALRLNGVDAKVLEWGMSGWHADFDRWSSIVGDLADGFPSAWTTGPSPTPGAFGPPTLATGEPDGASILASRVDSSVLDGLNAVPPPDVLGSPSSYQVFAWQEQADWDQYGHLDGAVRLTPGSLDLDTLGWLGPGQTVVVYGWSGQTSSLIAAWLNVLGYDAVSLALGMNGLVHSQLTSHAWPGPMGYAYETGP